MPFELGILLAAFGGGLFGAAIGGLPAFILTGVAVLVAFGAGLGGAGFDVLGLVVFGPVTGPHITFVGGVAAAAFAARRGDLDDGKDIVTPLAGLGDPLPLLVGGIFGAGGYALQVLLMNLLPPYQTAFYPTYIDVIAVVVAVFAIITRLAFGKTGLFDSLNDEARERGRLSTGGDRVWLAYQEGFLQASVVGLGTGILAAWAATQLAAFDPALLPFGVLLGYGVSATALIFLQFGFSAPVTHHTDVARQRGRGRGRGGWWSPGSRNTRGRRRRYPGSPLGRVLLSPVPDPRRHPFRPAGQCDYRYVRPHRLRHAAVRLESRRSWEQTGKEV